MAIELQPLPYPKDSLSPHLSAETLDFHYEKHHKSYVDKLNTLIKGTEHENSDLVKIIRNSSDAIFNNAAQAWNHTFYWNCLKPNGGGEPIGELKKIIDQTFGNFEKFKIEFNKVAVNTFGSGWTWLVLKNNSTLTIESTSNADTPIKDSKNKVLMTCDIWENAYYIDFRNARPSYLESYWKMINWDFVSLNLSK